MKLHSVVTLLVLVLFTTVPDDTEAVSVAWFLRIAAKLGVKLAKTATTLAVTHAAHRPG